MNLVEVMETFSTQADCIAYLERLKWHGSPECPFCGSTSEVETNVLQAESDAITATIASPRSR